MLVIGFEVRIHFSDSRSGERFARESLPEDRNLRAGVWRSFDTAGLVESTGIIPRSLGFVLTIRTLRPRIARPPQALPGRAKLHLHVRIVPIVGGIRCALCRLLFAFEEH
jgi:hypothetical protein